MPNVSPDAIQVGERLTANVARRQSFCYLSISNVFHPVQVARTYAPHVQIMHCLCAGYSLHVLLDALDVYRVRRSSQETPSRAHD